MPRTAPEGYVSLQVTGLRELQRALKATSEQTPKVIQTAHKDVAGIVVRQAQSNTDSEELASRIRAFGTTRKAGVRFLGHRPKGKSRATDSLLQEFGGRAPLFGDREHWYEVKAKKKAGYIVYPAIRSTRDEVMRRYLEALEQAIARYFAD